MNIRRAKEIFTSPQHIPVHYDGNPVWMEKVDEATQTARVHFVKTPEIRLQVHVADLQEL